MSERTARKHQRVPTGAPARTTAEMELQIGLTFVKVGTCALPSAIMPAASSSDALIRAIRARPAVSRRLIVDAKTEQLPATLIGLWHKDAIIYQLHVKSFFDKAQRRTASWRLSRINLKLDYIGDLGVNAILAFAVLSFATTGRWLRRHQRLSYRSPRLRHALPTSASWSARRCARKIRVITDLVVNHTHRISTRGFQRARRGKAGIFFWRNFYVWADSDQRFAGTRVIFVDTERSNWTWDAVAGAYYWAPFLLASARFEFR